MFQYRISILFNTLSPVQLTKKKMAKIFDDATELSLYMKTNIIDRLSHIQFVIKVEKPCPIWAATISHKKKQRIVISSKSKESEHNIYFT